MFLARVIGQVVSTRKEADMKGQRLLLLRPMLVDNDNPGQLRAGSNTVVAVDPVGAGNNDMVLFVQGSSARSCAGLKTVPVDAAIVGIVDSVTVEKKVVYPQGQDLAQASRAG